MRVCDWIAADLYDRGVRNIYGLMGGGAAGLNDGFIKHGGLKYVCFHHEQGAAHAATGEAKITGNLAVVNPTTGCGGTNCITAVLNAWQDGVPLLFISGNVRKDDCSRTINFRNGTSIRKYGIQEHDIIETVAGMTKYSEFVDSPLDIAMSLNRAVAAATTGRPGPVWLDIPADVQTAELPIGFSKNKQDMPATEDASVFNLHPKLETIIDILNSAEMPVILAGQGIKQSKTIEPFRDFVESMEIPFVTTYGARDLLPYDHFLNIGAIGIKGSRAGNFAMQASDALLVLGCSINTSHVGYDPTTWAPRATKMLVDIDDNELNKNIIGWNHVLRCDLKQFFSASRGLI